MLVKGATGDKVLSEPMLTKLSDTTVSMDKLGLNELRLDESLVAPLV